MGAIARHQYFERVLCRSGRRVSHDPARPGQDHQHCIRAERARASRDRALYGHEGCHKELDRGMCADWAKYGLQINAIAPGYFKTPLNQALVDNPEFSSWLEKRTPAARWGNVAELVGAAVFLSGRASSFVNGHTLCVDGGITTCL